MTSTHEALSDPELAELERLEREATPGPWAWDNRGEKGDDIQIGTAVPLDSDEPIAGYFDREDVIYIEPVAEVRGGRADAALIVALRNNARALIAAARENAELRAERDTLESACVKALNERDAQRACIAELEGLLRRVRGDDYQLLEEIDAALADRAARKGADGG